MRIWLITVGEPLPTDPGNERLLRTGRIAKLASNLGHDVTWWASTFNHMEKRHRTLSDNKLQVSDKLQIQLLHGTRYKQNVSIRRMINHSQVAKKFRRLASAYQKPDIILCSLPLLELCDEATQFGEQHGVPVVLDVRDAWPDAIVELAPEFLRGLVKFGMGSAYRRQQRACRRATAIAGITDGMIDWALSSVSRERSSLDRSFPMAYSSAKPDVDEITTADRFWLEQGIRRDKNEFIVCFFGTIGRHFEIDPIVEASRLLEQANKKVRFVLCGTGPHFDAWQRKTLNSSNIVMPGWIKAPQIYSLMQMSSVGLAPYVSSFDFELSIPNKPIEYLSTGLPVVSSLRGALCSLLAENKCGMTYENQNGKELAAIIAGLLDTPEQLRSMSVNAQRLFKNRFEAETVYPEMIQFLEVLAQSNQKANLVPQDMATDPPTPVSTATQ